MFDGEEGFAFQEAHVANVLTEVHLEPRIRIENDDLDAELLTAMLTTDGLDTSAVMSRRPQKTWSKNYTTGGQIAGGAWRCASQRVLFWNEPVLTLVTPTELLRIPGEFTAVQPTVLGYSVSRTLAARSDGGTSVITTGPDGYDVEDLSIKPDWNLLAISRRESAVIYSDDADTGTFVLLAKPGITPRRSPLSFNTYFRDVARPQSRMLTHTFGDGSARSGLLQLPIGHKAGDRHPVVLWAYPNSTPSINDAFSRANSQASTLYPVQYLLTKGFAFFQAPFPIDGKRSSEPMRAAVDAVVPWLDVLCREPDVIAGNCGFLGHSNAGYVALALEALSRRFKAIVAWGTFPELGFSTLHSWSGDVALDCAGNVVQADRMFYEDPKDPYAPQPAPPWKNSIEYIRNDPLFNLDQASTPLLLVEGEFDGEPQEMEEVYSTLRGRDVPVELAYYWGEGHAFDSPGNIRDSWIRTERFFRRYLRPRDLED